MKRILITLLSLCLLCISSTCLIPAFNSPSKVPSSKDFPALLELDKLDIDTFIYDLSGEQIKFKRYYHPQHHSTVIYYNMHDDENTAVRAMDSILVKYPGQFIELQFKGTRWVGGWLNQHRHFWFDPNRIYSDLGIYKTLTTYRSYTPYSKKAVKNLANFITDSLLNEAKIIIALHNNQRGFSIKKYLKGAYYEDNAAAVHVNPNHSPHDFFYVIDEKCYDFIVSKNFNVVLQSKDKVNDDGSLSVYCGKKNIPYVNIEAKEGHLSEQIAMIEILQEYLNTRFSPKE